MQIEIIMVLCFKEVLVKLKVLANEMSGVSKNFHLSFLVGMG